MKLNQRAKFKTPLESTSLGGDCSEKLINGNIRIEKLCKQDYKHISNKNYFFVNM